MSMISGCRHGCTGRKPMINTVTIAGRVINDPQIRRGEQGKAVVNFTLLYREVYNDSKSRKMISHWFSCVATGAIADLCIDLLKKGDNIALVGMLRQQGWDDGSRRNGKETVEIHVKDIEFMRKERSNEDWN